MPGHRALGSSGKLLRGTFVALLLLGCASGEAPPKSAANTTPPRALAPLPVDAASLEPEAAPALRFRAGETAGATRHDSEPKLEGPFALGETTVTLENKGPRTIRGPVEVVLPAATVAARIDGVSGESLRESRVPEREGRMFETPAITLGPGEKKVLTIRHAALASTPTAPRSSSANADTPKSVAVLLDTSLARTHQLARQIEILTAFARGLPKDTPLLVGAYDNSVVPLYEGKAGELAQDLVAQATARGVAGTSDVVRAMEWATRPRAAAPAPDRILIVSDGVDGLDEMATGTIASTLRDAGASTRVDVIVPRGPNDSGALRALATSGSTAGALVALEDDTAVARLLEGGSDRDGYVDPREHAAALVERDAAVAPEWLRSALAGRTEPRAKSWERIASLGKRVRGLPTVSEQRAQVDPMEDYSERAKPAAEPITVTLAEPAKATDKTAEKKVTPPELRPQIPPETIQQIVRRNFAALRFCYRDALRRDPKAGGDITIRFDIDETGAVPLARAAKSEL
ncbi:MAG: hypothetical protein JNK04_19525, partial [Myxococcales bacterium]|nr:hypothetical protein [Myxococcales bacterium]